MRTGSAKTATTSGPPGIRGRRRPILPIRWIGEEGFTAAIQSTPTRRLVPLDRRWTHAAGFRWHARVATDAAPAGSPPVVLVHGLGVSSRYMLPLARRLAPCFPTYAPDVPGFGRSEEPPWVLTMTGWADALVAWLDAVGLDRPVLLGNSLGCQAIVELALRRPDRLSAAILVGPTGDPGAGGLMGMLGRLLLDLPREPPLAIPVQALDYLRAGPIRVARTAAAMVADPVVPKLPRMPHPTLVVRGERDPIAPRSWAREVARLLPGGEFAEVAGAAHIVNYSHPDALAARVGPFIDRHVGAGSR